MAGETIPGLSREVRSAAGVAGAVLLASALAGALWGLLAPTVRLLVLEPGQGSALTGESVHRFDALALFVLIGAVVGLLSAAAVWQLRRVRGPILLLGLLLSSIIGALVMIGFGEAVAQWDNPRPVDPPVGNVVAVAPEVDTWLALIVQPLVASLLMLVLVALSPTDDLGTGFRGALGDTRPVADADAEPAPGAAPEGPAMNPFADARGFSNVQQPR